MERLICSAEVRAGDSRLGVTTRPVPMSFARNSVSDMQSDASTVGEAGSIGASPLVVG